MLTPSLFILAGFVALLFGGEFLVRGSVTTARRLGVSPLVIGITLVGFGTSVPELVTSVGAALKGAPGIAVGNVVGSNIANILLILGAGAVLLPIDSPVGTFRRDGTALIGSALLLVGLCLYGEIGRIAGAVLATLLVAYTLYCYRTERTAEHPEGLEVHLAEAESVESVGSLRQGMMVTGAGLAGVLLGAWLLLEGAVTLARMMGLSESVIGLSIVALGTSLPELATAMVAAWRKQSEVAFGNILGSCVFNILGILGVTALVHPVRIPADVVAFDIWMMLAVTLMMVLFAFTGGRICRREGAVLLAGYALYMWMLFDPGVRAWTLTLIPVS